MKLTREPLLNPGTAESCLDCVSAHLAREREGRAHVHLGRDDKPGVEMTLKEVRELRDQWSAILAEAVLA